MAVEAGTYEILSALDNTMAVDVKNGSTAEDVSLQIWNRNDTDAQKWIITNNVFGGSTSRIACQKTDYVFDVWNNESKNKTRIVNHRLKTFDAPNQQFTFIETEETGELNGNTVSLYKIKSGMGTNMVVDVNNADSTAGSSVQIYENNDTLAQRFYLVPSTILASYLATPSFAFFLRNFPMDESTLVSSYELKPYFDCRGWKFQVRYRTRYRTADMDNAGLTEWSYWKSYSDDSTACEGWGDVKKPNVEYEPWGSNLKPLTFSGSLSVTDVDYREYQIEIRSYNTYSESTPSWSKTTIIHGNSAIGTAAASMRPFLKSYTATLTPDGFAISFESSFPRDENTVTVSCDGYFNEYSESSLLSSDTVLIPYEDMAAIPEEGETVTLNLQLRTCDRVTASFTEQAVVTYDSLHGTTVGYDYKIEDSICKVTVDGGTAVYLWVDRGHGRRLVKFDCDENNTANVIPPLNTMYKIYLVKGDTSSDTWASKTILLPAIESNAYHITSLDASKDFAVELGEGNPPSFTPSYKRDITFATTTGRERDVAAMGSTTALTFALSGVLYDNHGGTMAEHDAAFDVVAHMGFCVFRSPRGFWEQAAITAASNDMSRDNVHSASFSFKAIEV